MNNFLIDFLEGFIDWHLPSQTGLEMIEDIESYREDFLFAIEADVPPQSVTEAIVDFEKNQITLRLGEEERIMLYDNLLYYRERIAEALGFEDTPVDFDGIPIDDTPISGTWEDLRAYFAAKKQK